MNKKYVICVVHMHASWRKIKIIVVLFLFSYSWHSGENDSLNKIILDSNSIYLKKVKRYCLICRKLNLRTFEVLNQN